jgi:formyl-CoA transferase
MLQAGLPAGPVRHVDEAMAAPHTLHREMVTELDGYRGLGTPIKMSRTPGGTRRPPPRFAEHTEEVLGRHGFGPDEIEALREAGVLVGERRK